ncbi:site-specific integrase [Klenkia terrae]
MPPRRRFGRVRKLPSGRWQARYAGPDGQDRSAPTTFATKTDAARFLVATETDMARGAWLDPLRSGIRLREYSQSWLAERTVRGRPLAIRTRETYQHSLDRWVLPKLGDLMLDRITPALVRTWHADVSAATGPTAARQAYAVLRAVMSTAVADDAVARNPCRIVGAGQARSEERPLLDVAQIDELTAAMPVHLRGLVQLGFWGHLRLGELVALRRADVDLDAGTVAVVRQVVETDTGPREGPPKAGSQRTVHLPPQGLDALRAHLEVRGPTTLLDHLFARQDGTALRAHHVHTAWGTARKHAGLPGAHLHDLRHAGLTLAAQSGATLAEVMRRAGHSSTRAAMIYQHAAERRDADVAAGLGQLDVSELADRAGTRVNRTGTQRARRLI